MQFVLFLLRSNAVHRFLYTLLNYECFFLSSLPWKETETNRFLLCSGGILRNYLRIIKEFIKYVTNITKFCQNKYINNIYVL